MTVITTPRRTIGEADIQQFACFVGDFHPLHVDEVYARASAFGSRVLHGPAVFAVTSGLIAQTGIMAKDLAFLGSSFRLRGPVRAGDTLQAEAEIIATRPTSDGSREVVEYAIRTFNERGEMVLEGSWTQLCQASG
jgi:acyl dehydratase